MPRAIRGLTDVRAEARKHTRSALNVLKSIALQPKSPPAARIAAAVALLDRGWGKSAQPHAGADGEGPIVVEQVTVTYVEPGPKAGHTNGKNIQPTNGAAKV